MATPTHIRSENVPTTTGSLGRRTDPRPRPWANQLGLVADDPKACLPSMVSSLLFTLTSNPPIFQVDDVGWTRQVKEKKGAQSEGEACYRPANAGPSGLHSLH